MVHVGLLTRPVKLEANSSSSKSESVINGHPEETQSIKTVMLQPQGTSLSASPATEIKEDFKHSSANSSSFRNDEQKSSTSGEQSYISKQPLGEPPPGQSYGSSSGHSLSIHRNSQTSISLPYYVFGVFDGHAGWGAAVSAANQLHHFIHVS